MLALARALMANPKVLLLDEPMLGLAPVIVEQVIELCSQLAQEGIAVVITEPSIRLVGRNVSRGYVMIRGRISEEITGLPMIEKEYMRLLGVTRSEEHTSELQSLMRISYAVFCLENKHYRQILKLQDHITTQPTRTV